MRTDDLLDYLLIREQIIADDLDALADFYSEEAGDVYNLSMALEGSLEMDNFLRFHAEFSERVVQFYDKLKVRQKEYPLVAKLCDMRKKKIVNTYGFLGSIEEPISEEMRERKEMAPLERCLEYEKRNLSVEGPFGHKFGLSLREMLVSDYYALEYLKKASQVGDKRDFLKKQIKIKYGNAIPYDQIDLSMIKIEEYSQRETLAYLSSPAFLVSIQYLLADHKATLARSPKLLYHLDWFTTWVTNYHEKEVRRNLEDKKDASFHQSLLSYSKVVREDVFQFIENEKQKDLNGKRRDHVLTKKYYPVSTIDSEKNTEN